MMRKEAVLTSSEVSRYMPGDRDIEKLRELRIVGVSTKIRAGHLPNVSQNDDVFKIAENAYRKRMHMFLICSIVCGILYSLKTGRRFFSLLFKQRLYVPLQQPLLHTNIPEYLKRRDKFVRRK
jgi:hypothetical protein